MTPDVGIVIQARMGSTRLPGKVLMPLAGRPLLEHVVGRLGLSRADARVVVATGDDTANDPISDWAAKTGVTCFRGSESDVLRRYVDCADFFSLKQVVRLTADNPFTDVAELDRLIALHQERQNDYTHSIGQLPVGVGAEVFSRAALERSDTFGQAPHHREHVNEYILENPTAFRIDCLTVPIAKQAPGLRLTVDTAEDHARAGRIITHCAGMDGNHWTTTEEAIAFCSRFA